MNNLEKKKEKERWEQIRKTLSNKKKRESQYRKTIIEREKSRKKRLSPIPESEEKTGGKNRKTKLMKHHYSFLKHLMKHHQEHLLIKEQKCNYFLFFKN